MILYPALPIAAQYVQTSGRPAILVTLYCAGRIEGAFATNNSGLSHIVSAVSFGESAFNADHAAPVVFVLRAGAFGCLQFDVLQAAFELNQSFWVNRLVHVEKRVEVLDLYFLGFVRPTDLERLLPEEIYRARFGGHRSSLLSEGMKNKLSISKRPLQVR